MSRCIALCAAPGSERLSRCVYETFGAERCYWHEKKTAGLMEGHPRRGETEEEQLRRLLDEWGMDPEWLFSGTDVEKVRIVGRKTRTAAATQ